MKLISFEKKLGLPGAICVTVGAVIGVGIFVIVGEIGALAGQMTSVAFLAAGAAAIFGTMVAVTLGSTIPADGGGFYYTKSLLGDKAGWIASWLIVIGALGSIGTVSLGVADYIRFYFPDFPRWIRPVIAIAIILGTWGINTIGIMASEKLQIAMVVQLASALLILVIFALINGGNPDFSQGLPEGHGTGHFLEAAAMAVLSYTGFNIIGELGDEVENPRRNIPLTIVFGLGIIIFIYVGIGWIVSGTMSASEMLGSQAALLDTSKAYIDSEIFMHYLNLAALFGAITSINAVFLAVPREFNAQAEAGFLPKWIMKFNPERQTFPVGIMIVAIAGIVLVLPSFPVGIYGLICVAGLILANVFFSIAVFRLFKLYPKEVETAPIPVRKWWLYPSAGLSTLFSLGFGVLAVFFVYEEIGGVLNMRTSVPLVEYWFGGEPKLKSEEYKDRVSLWLDPTAEQKKEIGQTFSEFTDKALAGDINAWKKKPASCAALILSLDYAPRLSMNAEADKARALKSKAIEWSFYGLIRNYDARLPGYAGIFYYTALIGADDADLERAASESNQKPERFLAYFKDEAPVKFDKLVDSMSEDQRIELAPLIEDVKKALAERQ